MKTLTLNKKSLVSLALATLLVGCGGGDGGSTTTPSNIQTAKEYFITASSSKAENTLLYTQEVSKFVDNIKLMHNSLSGMNGVEYNLKSYEAAMNAFYDANLSKLNQDDPIVQNYLSASENLNNAYKNFILYASKAAINEYNLDQFTATNTTFQRDVRKPRFLIIGTALVVTGFAAFASTVVHLVSSHHRKVFTAAVENESGLKDAIEILQEHNIKIKDDATPEEVLETFDSLSYNQKVVLGPDLTSKRTLSEENVSAKENTQFEKNDKETVDVMKKVVSKGTKFYLDTVVPSNNPAPVQLYKDSVDILGNVKTIYKNTKSKKIKVITASKTTEVSNITKTDTSLDEAKKKLNTLNNQNGFSKLTDEEIGDALNVLVQDQAKKDGDNNDDQLTSVKSFTVQEPILKEAKKDGEDILNADLAIPDTQKDESAQMIIVSDPENLALDEKGDLPESLIIDTVEDITPSSLENNSINIVNLDEESVKLNTKIVSENNTSITYLVTAEVKDIYRDATIYLEASDGSVIMGASGKELKVTSTHTQTVTWNIDVLQSAVMKLTRSDDPTYSDYISLTRKPIEPETPEESTIAGTYTGTYTAITESDECLPVGYTEKVVVDIDTNGHVSVEVELYGKTYHDTGITLNDNIIYGNGSQTGLEWKGNIENVDNDPDYDQIKGSYYDAVDSCSGSFIVRK